MIAILLSLFPNIKNSLVHIYSQTLNTFDWQKFFQGLEVLKQPADTQGRHRVSCICPVCALWLFPVGSIHYALYIRINSCKLVSK